MLGWAVTFLVIALIAAVFGFAGIAGAAAGIAQILFYIFLVRLSSPETQNCRLSKFNGGNRLRCFQW
jgi:uncharacterized membrane protein YtjA (UPF0391 family)